MANPSQFSVQSGGVIVEIGALLECELQAIEGLLREVVESESSLIREVGQYIALSSGKKLRPMITLLVARALGCPGREAPIHVAAAMEMIHVATLIHDDVIDKAQLRHGRPSVNARWGDDVAILMADYLYLAAFDLTLHHLDGEPMRLICQATRKMCEGEMFQIEQRSQWLSLDHYLYLISCKTACLFSACGALGAIIAQLPEETVNRTAAFGLDFGLAFQVTDDTLDYCADNEQWGKGLGMDLAAGKQTLPLILALQTANAEDRQGLEAILRDGRDLAAVRPYLERYDCFNRSLEVARGYASQASGHLDGLQGGDAAALDLLRALPDYVVSRNY